MSQNPAYSGILADAKASPEFKSIFLDLGCCSEYFLSILISCTGDIQPPHLVGSDVRKLALDGYPPSNIIGCDLRSTYIDLGHELYQDSSETCRIRFITGDMFDIPLNTVEVEYREVSEITTLVQLIGRVKYLYVGAVFHLFDENTQLAIAQRLARLVSREEGVVIFGRHQGSEIPTLLHDHLGRKRFGHNPESWRKMWQDAFTQTDGEAYIRSHVIVNAELSSSHTLHGIPIAHRQLTWSVHLGW
ncbi:hypothetical protein Clacol_008656 [Clathrus columnatus]|uniref:Methyltransferase domain-containing protein n=1 Tax=Clathrus columnatus TaxID=1419009 RepID=A0AAV5AKW1_9AGAM|nr:hypothetical protein Clacol_008656 [Clathrus columnatus]